MCAVCDMDFETVRGLREHYVQSEKHHYCHRCDLMFLTAWALQKHYGDSWEHHICNLCGKDLKTKDGLISHEDQVHY